MSDETLSPDDESARAIKQYITAGAAEGARAAAQRLLQVVSVSLDEVATTLQTLGAETSPQTITGAATLSGSGTLTASAGLATGAGAAWSGIGTLTVSRAEVTAAVDKIRAVREPDVEALITRPSAKWSRQQVIIVAVLLMMDVFLILPPATQQLLVSEANFLAGIQAIVSLLSR